MKNSEPEDKQKFWRLGAKYNKYTLCDIVPRLIIEARPAQPYTTTWSCRSVLSTLVWGYKSLHYTC